MIEKTYLYCGHEVEDVVLYRFDDVLDYKQRMMVVGSSSALSARRKGSIREVDKDD